MNYYISICHDYDNDDGFIEFRVEFEADNDKEAKAVVAEKFEHLINVEDCMGATFINSDTDEELGYWTTMPY